MPTREAHELLLNELLEATKALASGFTALTAEVQALEKRVQAMERKVPPLDVRSR